MMGMPIPSKFEQDFSIDPMDYEYDFFERFSCDYASDSVEEILQGCSYDDSVIDSLKNVVGEKLKQKYNCAFLIYDYDHPKTVQTVGPINFIAVVPYTK